MKSQSLPSDFDPYRLITDFLTAHTGILLSAPRLREVHRLVDSLMKNGGTKELGAYLKKLESSQPELDDLIASITVGETYFFREPAHFSFIRSAILPELQGPVRLWSAGCASGEEAYSLAIVIDEEGYSASTHFVATDISQQALEKARQAVYSNWSMRSAAEGFRQRYFIAVGDKYQLKPQIRSLPKFAPLNLAADPYPSFARGIWDMDLIMCRNVLIYFDEKTIASVAQHMFDCLAVGGWLITGSADPPLSSYAPYQRVVTPSGVYYRKGEPVPQTPANTRELKVERSKSAAGNVLSPKKRTRLAPMPLSTRQTPMPLSQLQAAAASAPSAAEPAIDRWRQAQTAFADGRYQEVIQLTHALADDPLACGLHVRALANSKGTAEAELKLQALIGKHKLSVELHYLHAMLLLDLGQLAEATRALRRLLFLDPSVAMAQFTLGSIYKRANDYDAARRHFRNARDLAAARPEDEAVALADGEQAGRLAQAASAELVLLGEPVTK